MQDIHEIIVEVITDEAAEYRKEAEGYKELYEREKRHAIHASNHYRKMLENEQEKVRHLEYQIILLKMKIRDISSTV